MNMEQLLTSVQFKQALFDVQDTECEQLAAEIAATPPVAFSQRFEKKMERLIRTQRKPYYSLINTRAKKTALALAATFLLLVTMVFSVAAIREPVVRFFVEIYENFSRVFFHQQEESFPIALETVYTPRWLPEGYELDDSQTMISDSFCAWTYANATGQEFNFEQYVITTTALRIDTEDIQTEEVLVNQYLGLFYANKGIQNVLWNDGAYGFSLSGSATKEELLHFAQSLQVLSEEK